MRIILLTVAWLLLLTALPVRAGSPEWITGIEDQKPFVFEIAYGQSKTTLPGSGLKNEMATMTVTQDLLRTAKRIRIGVSPQDRGTVEREDGCEIIFKLFKQAGWK